VHMASMGFPVVSVEPVQQHVDTIRGSINVNPAFQIELHHVGISSEDRCVNVLCCVVLCLVFMDYVSSTPWSRSTLLHAGV
jgi:hypothetical protein